MAVPVHDLLGSSRHRQQYLRACVCPLLCSPLTDNTPMECDFHGITYDPHRNNWKARIHYEGKEQYIGR